MLAVATPLLALSLAAGQGTPPPDDWIVADGTGTCSVSSVDFPDGPRGFAAGSLNCGLLTEDGGLHWTPVRVVPDQGQSLLWAHAASADELYAARRALYRSTDRGATWAPVGAWDPASGGSVFDVAFPSPGRLVAIKGGQVWRSDDAGERWTLAYPGEMDVNFHELHFPTPETGYATGGVVREGTGLGTVLRSDDGGASWTRLDFPHGKITAASFVDVDHGMAATQQAGSAFGLYVTDDGGLSWQALPAPPPGLVDQLKHRDAGHWYATTLDGCVFDSRDGGRSWRQGHCDAQGRALSSLSLRGGAAVAAGNDGLVLYENRLFVDDFEEAR